VSLPCGIKCSAWTFFESGGPRSDGISRKVTPNGFASLCLSSVVENADCGVGDGESCDKGDEGDDEDKSKLSGADAIPEMLLTTRWAKRVMSGESKKGNTPIIYTPRHDPIAMYIK
jgi:hypothetical protein